MSEDKEYELNMESCSFEIPKAEKKILMIVTNTDKFDEHHRTGVWFEEFAIPYNKFIDQGCKVTVASINGGKSPIDPLSENLVEDIKWHKAKEILSHTEKLENVDYTHYDAIVFPGGHGPMYDLARSELVAKLIEYFAENDKLIAAICHGPAALLSAKQKDGLAFVNGRTLTCFTNDEEISAGKDKLVPYFLEDMLKNENAFFTADKNGAINVVEDGNLITGQNFQSSRQFAEAILNYLSK